MKKTTHYKGHRWGNEEIRALMAMWAAGEPLEEMANRLNVTTNALSKMVVRLRANGIPLERRKKGHTTGRANKLWTQGEVEYLVRKREEKATAEDIAMALGRSFSAVQGMIQKLRENGVHVAMRGCGVRRLWDAEALKVVAIQQPSAQETAA